MVIGQFYGASEYELISLIHDGPSSQLYRGIHVPTGTLVVVKAVQLLDPDKKAREYIWEHALREYNILKRINHQNVIKAHGIFRTPDCLCIAQQNASRGDVFDLVLKRGPLRQDSRLKEIVSSLFSALQYLHDVARIVHRDIKPENVCFDENGRVLLIDFGLAEETKTYRVKGCVGTQSYTPPEVEAIKGLRRRDKTTDGRMADVWALGVLVHFMVTGRLPFQVASKRCPEYERFVKRHASGVTGAAFYTVCERGSDGEREEVPPYVSECLAKLVDRMLDPICETRLQLREIEDYIDLPWIIESSYTDAADTMDEETRDSTALNIRMTSLVF
eukprot:CFRG0370T1